MKPNMKYGKTSLLNCLEIYSVAGESSFFNESPGEYKKKRHVEAVNVAH